MDTYRVTAQALNVRDAPSLQGKVIGYLVRDQRVERLEVSADQYWFLIQTVEGLKGWCSHKFLVKTENDPETQPGDFPWLTIALQEVGMKEFVDPNENPRILDYLRSTSLGSPYTSSDETDWCSAFVNWCVEKAGYEGTDSARARSWLNWGKKIDVPVRGCIVIFKRVCPNGNPNVCGHVGFYMDETPTRITLLGGNQDDAVNIKNYSKANLLGYRMPGP